MSKWLRGGGEHRKFFALFFHLKLERGSVLLVPYPAAVNINVCHFPRCWLNFFFLEFGGWEVGPGKYGVLQLRHCMHVHISHPCECVLTNQRLDLHSHIATSQYTQGNIIFKQDRVSWREPCNMGTVTALTDCFSFQIARSSKTASKDLCWQTAFHALCGALKRCCVIWTVWCTSDNWHCRM